MPAPDRLVFVVTGLRSGGAEAMLLKLVTRLDRGRFAPIVVSLGGEDALGADFKAAGIPLTALGMRPAMPSPLALARLVRLVRAERPALLQGWMYHGNLMASAARAFAGAGLPVLWGVRQSLYDLSRERRGTAWVIRASVPLSRRVRQIIYNSEVSRRQHAVLGFADDRACVIGNGFDCQRFRPDPGARAALRRETGAAPGDVLIGLVARHHPMKGHAVFLRAAAALLRVRPQARFVLAGAGVDGAAARLDGAASPLAGLVADLGIGARTHLLGERRDMPQLTAGLDIATSSSLYNEGFPNAIGEAMACGVPCVVTDVGDTAAVVAATGRVVAPGDPAALATAWQALIDLQEEGRATLGQAARRRVLDHYAIEAVVGRYESLFAAVAAERR